MRLVWQFIDSSAIGGVERHIEMLARGLRHLNMECEVVLYASYGDNPWFAQLKAANIPYRVLKGSPGDLMKNIKKFRPALVHTHGYKAGILGRAVCRLNQTPVVSTFHSGERGTFPVYIYQLIDELSAFMAPSIAVSEPIQSRLKGACELVPNFVEMPTQTADPLRDRLKIAYVGRFSYEKAPDHFCALAERVSLSPALECVEWHAYGEGPLLEAAKNRAAKIIHFHGLAIDMSSIWPTLDLLILPSRAEGLPLAVLEAMSHGIPVIASHLGGLPDVITHGKNGWLFEPNNLDKAADYILKWAKMKKAERQLMFEQCRLHVAKNFSIQTRLKTMLSIYKRSGLELAS